MKSEFATKFEKSVEFTAHMAMTCAKLTAHHYEYQSAILMALGYSKEGFYWRTVRVRLLSSAEDFCEKIRSLSDKYSDVTSYIDPNGLLASISSIPIDNKDKEPDPERAAEYNDEYKYLKSRKDAEYEKAMVYQLPIQSLIESIEDAAREWVKANPVPQQEMAYYS